MSVGTFHFSPMSQQDDIQDNISDNELELLALSRE